MDESSMELQIQVRERPAQGEVEMLGPSIEHSINKIPSYLKEVNEQAYTPKVISIGPVHHANPKLQAMEKHKQRYLESFIAQPEKLRHCVSQTDKINKEDLRDTLWKMKDDIRRFYEDINLDDAKLMDIILLDATFILVFFHKISLETWEREDLMIERQKMIILSDLILLENQVPFFVLEKLFIAAFPQTSVICVAFVTFESFELRNLQKKNFKDVNIVHFTHLMRTFQLPPAETLQGEEKREDLVILSRSATQLQDTGVKFMVNTSSECLLDIKFEKSLFSDVLEIPCLKLCDETEALFRNIMAFEEFHSREYIQFMDYCIFMGFLVDTAEDIKVLCDSGILVNCLGERNSAASFFNRLNTNIYAPGFHPHFAGICRRLNEFCKKPSHGWKATLRHQYFGSPWIAASTIAAIILLLLTFIQTVCSIVK